MSTRNPMNERYQLDNRPQGKTRKSAASAKPATKAAASVQMEVKEKSKKGRKRSAKNADSPRRVQHPDTPEYRKWHRIWIFSIVAAIVLTLVGLLARNLFDAGALAIAMVVVGDAMLIAAVLIDIFKLSRLRTRYAQEMRADRSKAAKKKRVKEAAEREEAMKADARAQDLKAVNEGKALQAEKKKKSLNPFSTKNV